MLKKFFELIGIATCGYAALKVYDEYKKQQSFKSEVKKEEEIVEDPSVEVDDFFAEAEEL